MSNAVGRPLGRKNGEHMIMPWAPLEWSPVYDQMVALHIAGWSYATIGNHLGYSAGQVGNIIRSPEAQAIKDAYSKEFRDNLTKDHPQKLVELKSIATKRVVDLLNNDDHAKEAPFRMGQFAKEVLTGLGALTNPNEQKQKETIIVIPAEQAQQLIAGTAKADEARRLNAGPIAPVLTTRDGVEVRKSDG